MSLEEEIGQLLGEVSGCYTHSEEESLFESGIMSSIELLILIDELENKFNIKIESSDIDYSNLDTIRRLADFVSSKRK